MEHETVTGPKIICEPSANHLGDISNMKRLIDKAKEIGADYIKFQCYTADSITIKSSKKDFVLQDGPWAGHNLYELYDMAHTPREWFPQLASHCAMADMKWFASAYCEADVDFLQDLGCPMYKVASYEIVDTPLIEKISLTGRPVIISTGMAGDSEVRGAVAAVSKWNYPPLTMLHCVSAYPTEIRSAGLKRLLQLRYRYQQHAVGISDHSLGRDVAVAATALGADVIEKHMTLDRECGGPDAHFSMEPDEFGEMIKVVRDVAYSVEADHQKSPDEYSRQQRRSLYAVKDIARGEKFTKDNIRSIRPGYGLPPSQLESLLGTRSPKAYSIGDPLS